MNYVHEALVERYQQEITQ